MKIKTLKKIVTAFWITTFAVPTIIYAANITVPQSTAYGQVLIGNQSGGNYTPVATSTLGISGGSGTNFFTNFLASTSLTTGSLLEAGNFAATSTTATSTFSGPASFANTSTGLSFYNTVDQVTNYERGFMGWISNVFTIKSDQGGAGGSKDLQILAPNGSTLTLRNAPSSVGGFSFTRNISSATDLVIGRFAGTISNSAAVNASAFLINPTISQTGTAGYTGLLIQPTETSLGSGTHNLIQAGTSATTSLFAVDNQGTTTVAGRVAIGTTNPAAALDMKGKFFLNNSGSTVNTVPINGFSDMFLETVSSPGNNLADPHNYPLEIHTSTSDNSGLLGPGIAFSSSNVIGNSVGAVGAAIIHGRTGGNSQGNLLFYTKADTGVNPPLFALAIDKNQNVGIGTTSPTSKLTISAADSGTNLANASNAMTGIINTDTTNNNFGDIGFGMANSIGSTIYGAKISGVANSHTSGAENMSLAFSTMTGGIISEAMRILGNNNVGIGSTSPDAHLSILSTSNNNTPLLNIASSTAGLATSSPLYIHDNGQSSFGNTLKVASIQANFGSAGGLRINTGGSISQISGVTGTNLSNGDLSLSSSATSTIHNVNVTAGSSLLITGGSSATSQLNLQSTAAVGTFDSINLKVGNNGAIIALTTTSSGNVGIRVTNPTTAFMVNGTITSTSTQPTLSGCGTSPSITGTSNWGEITAGAAATGCTVTYATAFPVFGSCVVTPQTESLVNSFSYTDSTSGFIVTQTGLGGTKFNYKCDGY